MTSLRAHTSSVSDTRSLGTALAARAEAGDVLVLSGEMGAGKTALTQGLGAGLGVTSRITSPTFTIASTYDEGRLCLHHLDVYRLEHVNEALDVGLSEMVDDGGVVVIEWGDLVAPVLPADHLEVRITFTPLPAEGDADDAAVLDGRELTFVAHGPRWAARMRGLAEALAPWGASC